jgi:transcriptional regulator of acetoin/glycerol metabolism
MIASCMIALVGTTQIALDVAVAAVSTRTLQHIVHSGNFTEHGPMVPPQVAFTLPALLTAQHVAIAVN